MPLGASRDECVGRGSWLEKPAIAMIVIIVWEGLPAAINPAEAQTLYVTSPIPVPLPVSLSTRW